MRLSTLRNKIRDDYIGKRPSLHYRNLTAYKKDNSSCKWCSGQGVAYRFEDRDVIEGYKLAEKKQCLNCSGRGYLADEVIATNYADYFATVERCSTVWNRKNAALCLALAKLTKTDLKALGLLRGNT